MLKKTAIIAGALLLIFIISDIAARIWFPITSPSATMGIPFKLNSLGLRDKDYTIPKPIFKYRILTLGDANIWGVGLKEEETLPRRLEKSLGSEFSGIEVINAGCPGFNTVRERMIMQNLVDNYTPDMVLLFYNLNDIKNMKELKVPDDCPAKAFNIFEDDAAEFTAMQPGGAKKTPFFIRTFRIVRLMDLWIDKTAHSLGLNKSPRYEWFRTIDYSYTNENPGWLEAKNALAEMRDICVQRGIVFKVFIYPVMTDFTNYQAVESHRTVLKACGEMNIDCADLLPAFSGKSGNDYWVNAFNSFPSAEADSIVVRTIAPGLKKILLQANVPFNAGTEKPQ